MSIEQLANRLGLSRARVAQLEHAEIQDAVTLRTLKDSAEALECELVYAIVPKGNSTLEGIIKKRVQEIAKERVARVAHSMSLEEQSVKAEALNIRIEEQTRMLLEHLNKKFWAEIMAPNSRGSTKRNNKN
jgi:predicted DNA-binding mobile mystery protein A